jgi:hypothetical protein
MNSRFKYFFLTLFGFDSDMATSFIGKVALPDAPLFELDFCLITGNIYLQSCFVGLHPTLQLNPPYRRVSFFILSDIFEKSNHLRRHLPKIHREGQNRSMAILPKA